MPYPTEDEEQEAFVQWLELKNIPHSFIPNSTYTTSWSVKNRNKKLGLRAGLPDLLVVIPNKYLLFVEMKRRKAAYPTKAQKEWISVLNSVKNVEARVCRGCDEAIDFISSVL
jgi:hypothetical protein